MEIVRASFKPEFLNRLDDIVMFDPLTQENLVHIVDIQLARVAARLTDRRITLTVTDAAKAWLARTGFDPVYGARPLKRAIQKYLEDEMAEMIIRASVGEGDTIVVDFDKDKQEIVTNIKKSESAAEA